MGNAFRVALLVALAWTLAISPAVAEDFEISFDSAVIETGGPSIPKTPGVNRQNDVLSEPKDVVTLKGTISQSGHVTVPAAGVVFGRETRTIQPMVSFYAIDWRSPSGFSGTFDKSTGKLTLSGELEQTVTQLSNSCSTGPIAVTLSTETSSAQASGVRFTDGLSGEGTLVGGWTGSTAQPSGPNCNRDVLICSAKYDLAASRGTMALSVRPGLKFGVPSNTRCGMRAALALNQIVYSHDGRITVSGPDGSRLQELTHPGRFLKDGLQFGDDQPSLSPDESMVTFVRNASPYWPTGTSVAIHDRESDKVHFLEKSGDYSSGFRSPIFDLDGTHVYYIRTDKNAAVVRRETNGGRPVNISGGIPKRADLEFSDLDLSPDGSELLVGMEGSRNRDGHPIALIYKVSLSTGKAILLQKDASEGAWSPDGKKIIFESKRDEIGARCEKGYCSAQTRLFLMNSDGQQVRRVFPKGGSRNEMLPDFSPDGKRIAFTSDRSGKYELNIAKPNGSCLGQLTNGNLPSYSGSWGRRFESESVPPACGNRELKPRIELNKKLSEPIHGLPRMWLGHAFRGKSIYSPGNFNGRGTLEYNACLRFRWAECGRSLDISTNNVCGALPTKYASYATTFIVEVLKYRGAVIAFYGPVGNKGASSAVVLTGGRTVDIEFYGPSPYGTPRPYKWYLPVIDQLRPLWQNQKTNSKLPPARIGSEALTYYKNLLAFSRTHSIEQTAKRFKQNARSARYLVNAAKRFVKLGVKAIECGSKPAD